MKRKTSHTYHDALIALGVEKRPDGLDNYITSDSCWLWQGPLNPGGYAHIAIGLVHRINYQQKYGSLRDDQPLHHICHVRRCVNPDHVVPVSGSEHSKHHSEGRQREGGRYTKPYTSERQWL